MSYYGKCEGDNHFFSAEDGIVLCECGAFNRDDVEYTGHTESKDCWCEPYLSYKDDENGNEVWVHREVH